MSDDFNGNGFSPGALKTRIDDLDRIVIEGFRDIKKSIDDIWGVVQSTRKTNWSVIFGVIGIICTVMSFGYAVVVLQTNNAIGPLAVRQQMEDERLEEYRERQEALTARMMANDAEVAKQAEQFGEVEAQIREADQVRNLEAAATNRMLALLWQKAYREPLPGQDYYPAVTQPSAQQ
jgi:hypothetical protein